MSVSETGSIPQTTLRLIGCTPVPIAGYLKAIGLLRLVAEQSDAAATGWWEHDVFHLRSGLDRAKLCSFLLNDYVPTAIVAPWNGGSGFYPKDNSAAMDCITASESPRFSGYMEVISMCREVLKSMKLSEKPDAVSKPVLLQHCRNAMPDAALQWLDAAYILTNDGPKYPPLLGTGGNDGRLEFTNNYMQRLTELFDPHSGQPRPGVETLLTDSLFSECGQTRTKAAIGQFDPGSAGGANSTSGFDADAAMNIWDFVLALEGALSFAGASISRLGRPQHGSMSYPFCVRAAGVGYGSAATADEESSRSEMWMPLWSRPAPFAAVSHLLSEGRVEVGRRQARNGVDFVRAIASVGVDRGISSFQRFAFQKRNGLSYFAVPLGRFDVGGATTNAALISEIDGWLDRFRRLATGKNAPAAAGRALRRLEQAILAACQRDDSETATKVLVALGHAEAMLAGSPTLHADVPPVPLLSDRWLTQCYSDDSATAAEFRLAASLAAIGWDAASLEGAGPFRRHLEPVDQDKLKRGRIAWSQYPRDPGIIWTTNDLSANLRRLINRRIVEGVIHGNVRAPLAGKCNARLQDIAAFIDRRTRDQEIQELAQALMLLNWRKLSRTQLPWSTRESGSAVTSAYALLKLCLLPHGVPIGESEVDVKLSAEIPRRATAGDIIQATRLATRRLRASRLNPALEFVPQSNLQRDQRIAAALAFPIPKSSVRTLCRQALRHDL